MTGVELEMKAVFPNHVVRGQICTWHETQRAPYSASSTPTALASTPAAAQATPTLPASHAAPPALKTALASNAGSAPGQVGVRGRLD